MKDRRENVADDVQGKSVLIVDDDPQNLRLLTAVLERGGLEPQLVTARTFAIKSTIAGPQGPVGWLR